jgi:hypothetical protein
MIVCVLEAPICVIMLFSLLLAIESDLQPSSNNTITAFPEDSVPSFHREPCLDTTQSLCPFLFPSTDDAAAARASAAALLLTFEVSSSCFSPIARMVMMKRSRPVDSAEC